MGYQVQRAYYLEEVLPLYGKACAAGIQDGCAAANS